MHFHPFRNYDLPALADLWRRQPPLESRWCDPPLLAWEDHVFNKPYFDADGLILAWDGPRLIGCAHAGWSFAADGQSLDRARGVLCLALAAPEVDAAATLAALIEQAESHCAARGAVEMLAGPCPPDDPFYFGWLGGCQPAGVSPAERDLTAALLAAGYAPRRRRTVARLDLKAYRPLVDRRFSQLMRKARVGEEYDPPAGDWRRACVRGAALIRRFVCEELSHARLGALTLWLPPAPVAAPGGPTAGLLDLDIDPGRRRQGYATFLLAHALKQLKSEGVPWAEAHYTDPDLAAAGLLGKFGFQPAASGAQYGKSLQA